MAERTGRASRPRPASELTPVLSFGDLLDLVAGRMPRVKRGTYDRADPTAYENREGWVTFQYSPFTVRGYPGEFRVKMNDCTWGVEVTVLRPDGSVRLQFYWDRNCGGRREDQKIHLRRGTGPDVLRFMATAVLMGEWSAERRQPAEPDYPYAGYV